MSTRTRLTAVALAAATTLGLGLAGPAGAAEPAYPNPTGAAETTSGRAASKTFSYATFANNGASNITETFTAPGTTPIVGQFKGSTASDILWYTPGAGGDALWQGTGDLGHVQTAASISGTYTPLVGTFSSPDGYDDVLFWAQSGASQRWDFNPDGTITKSSLPNVSGPGQLLLGDFAGDSITDVVRYRPGTSSDAWWDFQTMSAVSRPFNVNGTFKPVVGTFAGDTITDILWYAPGAAGDPLWDFNGGGTKVQWDLSINGTYTPIVGNFSNDGALDIVWYAPGQTADHEWDFEAGGYEQKQVSVGGTYTPIACTCIQDAQSAYDDIIWYGPGSKVDNAWRVISNTFAYTSHQTNLGGTSVAGVGIFGGPNNREGLLIRH